jgi:hypothetical protein
MYKDNLKPGFRKFTLYITSVKEFQDFHSSKGTAFRKYVIHRIVVLDILEHKHIK